MPGAPTVFYGDEVGVTGDDDPDDRRTYPWLDKGGKPDASLLIHYTKLNWLRKTAPVLVNGDFKVLLADDASGIVVYGRKTESQAALVIINRSGATQTGVIPVAGYLPDGVSLYRAYAVGTGSGASLTVTDGAVNGSIGPLSAVVFVTRFVDLKAAPAPANLRVTDEGDATVGLAWDSVPGAAGYNLYRSPVSGGGWIKLNGAPLTGTDYTDNGLRNAQTYFYVVTSLDAAGNESKYLNEVSGLPRLAIGWANLQWPPTINHTISAVNRTDTAYGQVWIDGFTSQPGPTPNLRAQLGFGPANSDPNGNLDWTWYDASFNVDAGNNDEFKASM